MATKIDFKPLSSWYNFSAADWEYREDIPVTDDEALQYIPDYPPAYRNLYKLQRKMGKSIIDAMIETLGAGRSAPPHPAEPAAEAEAA